MSDIVSAIAARHAEDEAAGPFIGRRSEQARLDRGALLAEIARLREERKPVAWCVQAAAGSMVHAGTHSPIDAAVLIQCKDEANARMLSCVYGHKVLAIVEADAKEVGNE